MRKMSEDARARMQEHMETWDDWEAVCSCCGKKVKGTMKDVLSHKCGEGHG